MTKIRLGDCVLRACKGLSEPSKYAKNTRSCGLQSREIVILASELVDSSRGISIELLFFLLLVVLAMKIVVRVMIGNSVVVGASSSFE